VHDIVHIGLMITVELQVVLTIALSVNAVSCGMCAAKETCL